MIVIADDITGAAEIAGIVFARGEKVRLVCGDSVCCRANVTNTTMVIATDTRSMSEDEAVAETRRVAAACGFPADHTMLFKKTDSALRGHVMAELVTLMKATGYRRAVYIPANPSKGRVIRNGVYLINDVPIHKTAFSYDPEFPAKNSLLQERFPNAEAQGILMPDVESEEDIRQIITTYNDGKTLFAGAADLFSVMLDVCGLGGKTQDAGTPGVPEGSSLILCGSTQSKVLDVGFLLCPMPREVYDGVKTAGDWFAEVSVEWPMVNGLVLTIPYFGQTGKNIAIRLRTTMAEMTKRLVEIRRPDHLIIEGGATAWATLRQLGWTQFFVECQMAPGVVQMRAENGTLVTLKPGSYPWGDLFLKDKR